MVRTKADRVSVKAVGSKAPHKIAATTTPSKKSSNKGGRSYSGGNPYHPRDTPDWQKPITSFFNESSNNELKNESTNNIDNTEPSSSFSLSIQQNKNNDDRDGNDKATSSTE